MLEKKSSFFPQNKSYNCDYFTIGLPAHETVQLIIISNRKITIFPYKKQRRSKSKHTENDTQGQLCLC